MRTGPDRGGHRAATPTSNAGLSRAYTVPPARRRPADVAPLVRCSAATPARGSPARCIRSTAATCPRCNRRPDATVRSTVRPDSREARGSCCFSCCWCYGCRPMAATRRSTTTAPSRSRSRVAARRRGADPANGGAARRPAPRWRATPKWRQELARQLGGHSHRRARDRARSSSRSSAVLGIYSDLAGPVGDGIDAGRVDHARRGPGGRPARAARRRGRRARHDARRRPRTSRASDLRLGARARARLRGDRRLAAHRRTAARAATRSNR